MMSLNTPVRPATNGQRLVAICAALAMLMSLMVAYSERADAHSGIVTWGCEGWSVDLDQYFNGADIRIVEDGSVVESRTNWTSYSNSGVRDPGGVLTLQIIVDAYDDDAQPVYEYNTAGSFSPNWPSGEYSFTLNIELNCGGDPGPDPEPEPHPASVQAFIGCELQWTGGAFVMNATVHFGVDPDPSVVSVTITPHPGGDGSIAGAEWTGSPVSLAPWGYDYTVNYAEGFEGPAGGELDFDRQWFVDNCSCPTGSIDVSNSGILLANNRAQDSLPGSPDSQVTISEGNYHITLASYDDHHHNPDQTQPQETWKLADAEDANGAWESPATGDLPNNLNFMSYKVTGSTPVYIPAFSNDALWVVHGAAGPGNVNSIQPSCAMLTEVVQTQSVTVQKAEIEGVEGNFRFALAQAGGDTGNVNIADGGSHTWAHPDTWSNFAPGDYTLTEAEADGYNFVGATCTSDMDGFQFSEVTNGVAFTVRGGENVTCVFTNEVDSPDPGTVTITKKIIWPEVIADALGAELESKYGGKNFWFDGDLRGFLEDDESIVATAPVGVTFTAYEEIPEGWQLQSVTCDATGGEYQIAGNQVDMTVTAELGEVDCTFYNTPDVGIVVIEKNALLGSTSEAFDFVSPDLAAVTGDDDVIGVEIGGSYASLVPVGEYEITESIDDALIAQGWGFVRLICEETREPNSTTDGDKATVKVEYGEIVTCTWTNTQDEVLASILVTVGGDCNVVNEEGVGEITVTVSVADGATVEIRDAEGNVVARVTNDATIKVEPGDYVWQATANGGFEFPTGFVANGSLVIDDCTPVDELPLTGIQSDALFALSTMLLGSGLLLVMGSRRRDETTS